LRLVVGRRHTSPVNRCRCAVCLTGSVYWCLKQLWLAGTKLSRDEELLVGVGVPVAPLPPGRRLGALSAESWLGRLQSRELVSASWAVTLGGERLSFLR
jgi:hypothetical protein